MKQFTLNGTGKDLVVNSKGVYIIEKNLSTFIPLRSIEAVVIKEGSVLSGGYILFRTPGSYIGSNSGNSTDMEVAMDRQAVMFKKAQNEMAIAIRDAIAEELAIKELSFY